METTASVFWHRDLPPIDAEPIAEHTESDRDRERANYVTQATAAC